MGFCVPAPVIAQPTLQGLQYFRLLGPLFDHLHRVGTARDRAGNRQPLIDTPDWQRTAQGGTQAEAKPHSASHGSSFQRVGPCRGTTPTARPTASR